MRACSIYSLLPKCIWLPHVIVTTAVTEADFGFLRIFMSDNLRLVMFQENVWVVCMNMLYIYLHIALSTAFSFITTLKQSYYYCTLRCCCFGRWPVWSHFVYTSIASCVQSMVDVVDCLTPKNTVEQLPVPNKHGTHVI